MSRINTDIPELQGYDSGISLENLHNLLHRQERLDEIRIAHLYELADAICRDCDNDKDTVESIMLSLRSTATDEAQRDDAHLLTEHLDLLERMLVYRRISDILNGNSDFYQLPVSEEILPADAVGRIAYMKSNVTSKAYLKISPHISGCRATEFYSFEDACAEVVGGQCEYCLLPIESTEAGKLHSFLRLIEKYDLKIAATCDIPVRSGADAPTTRFALLRRSMSTQATGGELGCINSLSDLNLQNKRENYRLELIHRSESGNTLMLTELLMAAEFCGMNLLRADTSPAPEPERYGSGTYVVFSADNSDIITFLWYIALEAPTDSVIGLYHEITSEE